MLQRFEGDSDQRLRVEALAGQETRRRRQVLAEELADKVELRAVTRGDFLIEQGPVITCLPVTGGNIQHVVNGRVVGQRSPNDHVGEMAAIEPTQRRLASVIANEDAVVAKLSEPEFSEYLKPLPGNT